MSVDGYREQGDRCTEDLFDCTADRVKGDRRRGLGLMLQDTRKRRVGGGDYIDMGQGHIDTKQE